MPPKPPEMAVLSGDASENSPRLFGSSLRRANSWPKKSTQPAAKMDPLCVALTKSWPDSELRCRSWLILLVFTWSSGCRNATALNLGISTAYRTAKVRAAATITARSSSRDCTDEAAKALVEGGLDILDDARRSRARALLARWRARVTGWRTRILCARLRASRTALSCSFWVVGLQAR